MLHGHGDNAYRYNTKICADFSSNVYYQGPDPALVQHLQHNMQRISHYPEVTGEQLTTMLANHHNIQHSNVLVTNGATEAFYLLALRYRTARTLIVVPSFAEYADACTLHQHHITYTTIHELHQHNLTQYQMIWLCNPNNPNGHIIKPDALHQLISSNPATQFVVDEAYTHFTLHNISMVPHLATLPNLIIVRSMTKEYAIPGLRLGYIMASSSVVEELLACKEPWSVNAMALEAGHFLLNNTSNWFNPQEVIKNSLTLQEALRHIPGITVTPSQASFFLMQLSKSAHTTTQYLVQHHGILIRNADNFRSLTPYHVRISTQNSANNRLLIDALQLWMSH